MIISPVRRFIFVHIPKTGGTSMALALEGRAMKDDILIGDTPKAQRRKARLAALTPAGRLWKHSTLADIAGVVDPSEFFVLTLVRNPWDRVVSYYHWLRTQGFSHPAVHLAQGNDFAGFLQHPQTAASLRSSPARSYVTDAAGTMHCRLFARLERVNTDLDPFWDHVGFRLALPQVNASVRDRDWRRYYTPDLAALVADICAEDIAAFGYRYDG